MQRTNIKMLWGILVLGLFTCTSISCSSTSNTVSGKVTFDGVALPSGNVTFFDAGNHVLGTSSITGEGSYAIKNLPAGEVRIAVQTSPPRPNRSTGLNYDRMRPPDAEDKAGPTGSKPDAPPKVGYVAVPPKFNDPATSKVVYTVKTGEQIYNIDLK